MNDTTGPQLPPTADWLRQRFAANPDGARQASVVEVGLAAQRAPQSLIAAAVLVPLVLRETGLTVLLTQRTAHLRDHAGQISFPGGRCEEQDAS